MSRTFSPTIRSSMWSTIPTPWRIPISAARSISSTSPSRSSSSATGTPASNETETTCGSSGASSGRVTSWNTSSSGACERSSIHLPSDERPHRLSSIEYGALSVPPLTGIPCLRAYAISSSRPIAHERTGAITFSSGASVAHVAVERAELHRLALDDLVVLPRLPQVDRQRDDLGLVLVLDPLEHHARVQPARVEEEDAVDLVVVGLVG